MRGDSVFNEKSIVMPLGEVKITRKVKSLLIVFRTNSNIDIWDQNKKRIFENRNFGNRVFCFLTFSLENERLARKSEENRDDLFDE